MFKAASSKDLKAKTEAFFTVFTQKIEKIEASNLSKNI